MVFAFQRQDVQRLFCIHTDDRGLPPPPPPPSTPTTTLVLSPISLYIFLSPAVPLLTALLYMPSSQQFVYGTLFAKLIFPPFKWEPAS